MEEKTLKKGIIKNFLGFSMHSYVGFIIVFISTYFVTRFFSTEESGKISLFLTVQSLLLSISLLGVDQAYCRFYNDKEGELYKKNLFKICSRSSFLAGIILSFICIIFYMPLSNYISNEYSFFIVFSLVVNVMGHIMCRYFNLHQRMQKKILSYTFLAILVTCSTRISYLIAIVIDPSFKCAIIFITISIILICLFTTIFFYRDLVFTKIEISVEEKNDLKNKVIKFGIPLLPVSLFSWLNTSIPQFAIKKYLDYSEVGIYSNAVTIVSIINLIQSGFNSFWVPFVYEQYNKDNDIIEKVHRYITYIMIAFALCLILFQDFIYLIIGDSYKSSQQYFALLLISPICYTIAETTGVGINISKKSYLHIYHYLFAAILNITLVFLLIPRIGILGAGIAVAVSSIFSLTIKTFIGERYYKCVTKKTRLILSLILIFIASIINYVFFEKLVFKYGFIFVLLILLMFIYWKETVEIIKIGIKKIKKE